MLLQNDRKLLLLMAVCMSLLQLAPCHGAEFRRHSNIPFERKALRCIHEGCHYYCTLRLFRLLLDTLAEYFILPISAALGNSPQKRA